MNPPSDDIVPTLNRFDGAPMLGGVTERWFRPALVVLLFLSGFGALGAQMAWTKLFANGLGHELPAVLAVVAAVMGGMAAGAGALDGRLARGRSPGLWYAALEGVIALWGCASVLVIPLVNDAARQLIGADAPALSHWVLAFALPFLALLPATAAMGATLPAMDRWLAPLWRDRRCLGALYAANTLGAVTGAWVGAFVALPVLGLTRSVALFAQANLLCGVLAWLLATRPSGPRNTDAPNSGQAESNTGAQGHLAAPACNELSARRINGTIFLTGLLALGMETLGVRLLSQVLENTVYTYAVTLAVFLGATALGAASYQRWWRGRPARAWLAKGLAATSVACALGAWVLTGAHEIYRACRGGWVGGVAGGIAAETVTAAAVVGPAAVLMDLTMPVLS
ncbi:MAG: hypothetical protein RMK20_16120, partial [Verrucomicrobiales bacterium]|nr:hypothetical protein [Verrucomicrobiales bacterium]